VELSDRSILRRFLLERTGIFSAAHRCCDRWYPELFNEEKMPPAPVSPFKARRHAAVHKLRLLGTPAEERFDAPKPLAAE